MARLPARRGRFRAEAGVRPGVRSIGSGTISDRVWAGPAAAVLGIDAPAIHGSSNQIVPVARARVSLRLAPGDDAVEGRRRLIDHLKAHAPWGVEVTIADDAGGFEAGQGHVIATNSPAFGAARAALAEAYGVEPVEIGSGGSIPLVPMLVDTFPGIEVLIVGAMDDRSNIHSVNESVDLGDLERSALAEALFLCGLAAT
ncbi:MAG: peptidase dimerization domain-containing protein [Actinomycetota bacterium]